MSGAATRLFALLGDPVTHSLSPALQNAAIKHAGVDATYVALRCSATDFSGLMFGLAHAGGGGNVTLPHKGSAAEMVDVASKRVRATGACNTFWLERGRVRGENTDVPAFTQALRRVIEDLHGAHVLIVGAGGAARAAVYALLEEGCDAITVLGRSRARGPQLRRVAGRHTKKLTYTTSASRVRGQGFDLVVNATPLGLRTTDRLPLRFEQLAGLTAVFDMVYKKGGTAWTSYAQALGIPAVDGKEMLVFQAAAAFAIWFDTEPPISTMRGVLARMSVRA